MEASALGWIGRPRLVALLDQRFDRRVVALVAGAGYGKSTLLGQTFGPHAERHVVIRCGPADRAASTLTQKLLAAVHDRAAAEPAELATIGRVFDAIWALAPEPFSIVFDDVHELDHPSGGLDLLCTIVREAPDNVRVVLAGRSLPPVGLLGQLSDGRAAVIGEDELRLTVEDVAGRVPDPVGLIDATAGWPALVHLHRSVGPGALQGYFHDEYLARLAPEARTAFAALVAAGGADRVVTDLLVGAHRSALARLPLVADDGDGGLWPHDLWGTWLGAGGDTPPVRHRLRRLCGELQEIGRHAAAFELAVRTHCDEEALHALFDACNDQVHPPEPDVLRRWRSLVAPHQRAEPEVRYLEFVLQRADDPWASAADSDVEHAMAVFRSRGEPVRELQAAVRLSFSHWVRCDGPALAAGGRRGAELAEQLGPVVDPILALNRMVRADLDGDHDELFRATASGVTAAEPRLAHFAPLLMCWADLAHDRVTSATGRARAAADAARAVEPAAGTGLALLAPAICAWRAGTRPALPVDPGPRHNLADRVPTIAWRAVLAADRGDDAAADDALSLLNQLVPAIDGRTALAGCLALAHAHVAVCRGRDDNAADALARHLDGLPIEPGGARRVLLWAPAVPWLLHERSRAALDPFVPADHPVRTLARLRAGERSPAGGGSAPSPTPPALPEGRLPPPWALELALRWRTAGGEYADHHVQRLVDHHPESARRVLAGLAAGGEGLARTTTEVRRTVRLPPRHRLRLSVLGGITLARGGEPVDDPDWQRSRVRELVAMLAVHHRPVRREVITAAMWPDLDASRQSTNLRVTLSYAQRALQPERDGGDATWFIRHDADSVLLTGEPHLQVDLWEVERRLERASVARRSRATADELDALVGATDLWVGPLCPAVDAAWVEARRAELDQQLVEAATRAAELLEARSRDDEALILAGVVTGTDPFHERAHRIVVRILLRRGDRRAAHRAARACLAALADLGVAPDDTTIELCRQAGAG